MGEDQECRHDEGKVRVKFRRASSKVMDKQGQSQREMMVSVKVRVSVHFRERSG